MKQIESELFVVTDGDNIYDEEGLTYTLNLHTLSSLAITDEEKAREICEKLNLEAHPNLGLVVKKLDVFVKFETVKVKEGKVYEPVLELFSLSKKTCYYLKYFLMNKQIFDRSDDHFECYLKDIGLNEIQYDLLEPLLKDPTQKLYTKMLVSSTNASACNVRIYSANVEDIVKIIYKQEDSFSSDVVVWK